VTKIPDGVHSGGPLGEDGSPPVASQHTVMRGEHQKDQERSTNLVSLVEHAEEGRRMELEAEQRRRAVSMMNSRIPMGLEQTEKRVSLRDER
jgi:hypothetical protein